MPAPLEGASIPLVFFVWLVVPLSPFQEAYSEQTARVGAVFFVPFAPFESFVVHTPLSLKLALAQTF